MEQFLYEQNKNKHPQLNMWMVFPGIYSFSMSSLGYLSVFKTIDMLEYVVVERICTDTVQTMINPKDLDLIGVSFSFDLDFLNIFKILDKYKIPLESKFRTEGPIVFGGGPVLSANPTPFGDFFDFIIVGDGEQVNVKAIEICKLKMPKEQTLKALAKIEGIYVPSESQKQVKKANCGELGCISTPILSERSFFKNTYIIEIARGCGQRCGFCLASYLNLPTRFADYDEIINSIELGLAHTNKIALLGALISAHPRFEDICNYIYQRHEENPEIEISISSLRADSIEPNVVKTLVACGQKNTTIAIEAGSDRLRKVINKNLTQEQIFKTVRIAYENGLKGLKIYAMIGLPSETQDDLKEMIALCKLIKKEFKGFNLGFSFSTFVPKPHTPFQWCAREDIKSLEKKQGYLKKEFHKMGIKANFSSAKWDYYQALLSRGDGRLGGYIKRVYELGGNLGAFKTAYREVAEEAGLPNSDEFAQNEISLNSHLAWGFIELAPGLDFLKKEHVRLLQDSALK